MRQGITLQELASEVTRQKDSKVDYVSNTKQLRFNSSAGEEPTMDLPRYGRYDIGDFAQRQIADRIGIPVKYYEQMKKAAPSLLANNVNYWFENAPEQRMLRTLDGRVRAFLSERYRPMDNYDLAEAVLPTLASSGAEVHSCQITEQRMYIKAVVDSVKETVPPPQGRTGSGYNKNVDVSPGIVISNSEIGHGSLSIQPAVHFLYCTNLAVWAEQALRKYHVGRGNFAGNGGGSDDVWRFLSDETRKLTDAALWSQVRDLVKGALEGDIFDKIVADLRRARESVFAEDKAPGVVERLSKRQPLKKGESNGVLSFLIDGGDLSKFGLSNAVTRVSQEVRDYDRASFLERLGGEVIVLKESDWLRLVN